MNPGGSATGGTADGARLMSPGKAVFTAPAAKGGAGDRAPRNLRRRPQGRPLEQREGDGLVAWSRSNDVDGSPLVVDGKADAESMFESKPGDMTARVRTHERKVNLGDSIMLTLEGDFGAGKPELPLAFKK